MHGKVVTLGLPLQGQGRFANDRLWRSGGRLRLSLWVYTLPLGYPVQIDSGPIWDGFGGVGETNRDVEGLVGKKDRSYPGQDFCHPKCSCRKSRKTDLLPVSWVLRFNSQQERGRAIMCSSSENASAAGTKCLWELEVSATVCRGLFTHRTAQGNFKMMPAIAPCVRLHLLHERIFQQSESPPTGPFWPIPPLSGGGATANHARNRTGGGSSVIFYLCGPPTRHGWRGRLGGRAQR